MMLGRVYLFDRLCCAVGREPPSTTSSSSSNTPQPAAATATESGQQQCSDVAVRLADIGLLITFSSSLPLSPIAEEPPDADGQLPLLLADNKPELPMQTAVAVTDLELSPSSDSYRQQTAAESTDCTQLHTRGQRICEQSEEASKPFVDPQQHVELNIWLEQQQPPSVASTSCTRLQQALCIERVSAVVDIQAQQQSQPTTAVQHPDGPTTEQQQPANEPMPEHQEQRSPMDERECDENDNQRMPCEQLQTPLAVDQSQPHVHMELCAEDFELCFDVFAEYETGLIDEEDVCRLYEEDDRQLQQSVDWLLEQQPVDRKGLQGVGGKQEHLAAVKELDEYGFEDTEEPLPQGTDCGGSEGESGADVISEPKLSGTEPNSPYSDPDDRFLALPPVLNDESHANEESEPLWQSVDCLLEQQQLTDWPVDKEGLLSVGENEEPLQVVDETDEDGPEETEDLLLFVASLPQEAACDADEPDVFYGQTEPDIDVSSPVLLLVPDDQQMESDAGEEVELFRQSISCLLEQQQLPEWPVDKEWLLCVGEKQEQLQVVDESDEDVLEETEEPLPQETEGDRDEPDVISGPTEPEADTDVSTPVPVLLTGPDPQQMESDADEQGEGEAAAVGLSVQRTAATHCYTPQAGEGEWSSTETDSGNEGSDLSASMDQLNDILTNKSKLDQAFQDAKNRGKKNVVSVDLWVKAGSDGLRNGADPMCQQVFLVLMRKSRDSPTGECQFNVKTVNLYKPHDDFKALGLRNAPAVVYQDDVYETLDDIIEFVDSKFPRPALNYFDPDAEDATNDLFSKFAWYIKEVNKDPKTLDAELAKIDQHLADEGTKYLTGGSISHLDCRIMPVLHHINVAAAQLKGYTVPPQLQSLQAYLKHMYSNDIFRRSAPSDQEIVLYWAERKDTPDLPAARLAELARQEPSYTHDKYELADESGSKAKKKPKAK